MAKDNGNGRVKYRTIREKIDGSAPDAIDRLNDAVKRDVEALKNVRMGGIIPKIEVQKVPSLELETDGNYLTKDIYFTNIPPHVLSRNKDVTNEKIMEQVLEECAKSYRIAVEDLLSRRKRRLMVVARHTAFFLIRKYCPGVSFDSIGSFIGGRDHTSALNSFNIVKGKLNGDDGFLYDHDSVRDDVERVKEAVYQAE